MTRIVWCTGYTGDFSRLPAGLTDTRGRPIQHRTAGAAAGLWFIGLRWLTRRSSGNFLHFPTDAAGIADAARPDQRRCGGEGRLSRGYPTAR